MTDDLYGYLGENLELVWILIGTLTCIYVVIFLARCLGCRSNKEPDETGIDMLPDELLVQIFMNLSLEELIRCEGVCRRWRKVALDGLLWNHLPVACSAQLGTISERRLAIIASHKHSVRHLKMQYVLKYPLVKFVTGQCLNLTAMELIMCRLEKEFEEHIMKWTNLQKLNLKNSLLKSESDLLIQYDKFKKLKYLRLSHFGLSFANCDTLLHCSNLNYISIDKIRGLKIEYIKLLINTKQSTLQGLRLYGDTSIDDEVLFLLAKCPKLFELAILRCDTLSDKALVAIASMPKIEILQLWSNDRFSEEMLMVALKSPVLTTMKSLSLSKVENVTPKVVDVISATYTNLNFLALYLCPKIIHTDYERTLKTKFKDIEVVLY